MQLIVVTLNAAEKENRIRKETVKMLLLSEKRRRLREEKLCGC